MATDASKNAARRRRSALQDRLWGARLELSETTARRLHGDVRLYLRKASDSSLVRESPIDIHRDVELRESEPREVNRHPASEGRYYSIGSRTRINGGVKERARFTRTADGAWFDFNFTVVEGIRKILLVAYRFQMTFEGGEKGPSFLRWDLDSVHAEAGLRSHLHPGTNSGLRIPIPVLSPVEFLDLFIHGLDRERPGRRGP